MKRKGVTGERAALARRRAELIVEVQSGLLSAAQAASALGVSRKTYYKWESRGLEGMIKALHSRVRGRPSQPDNRRIQALNEHNEELENQLKVQAQTLKLYQSLGTIGAPAVNRSGSGKKP